MDKIAEKLKAYIDTHPLDLGDSDCETVLDQLYQAYAESHESDPPEIRESFKELDELLGALPLDDSIFVDEASCLGVKFILIIVQKPRNVLFIPFRKVFIKVFLVIFILRWSRVQPINMKILFPIVHGSTSFLGIVELG